jgi:undecaprenol kinase
MIKFVRSLFRSFRHALHGIGEAVATERMVRIHIIIAILVLAVLDWLQINGTELAVVILAIGGVVTTEVINTAVEKLLDHLHPEQHDRVRFVKDAMAGAVLVAAVVAAMVGVAVLLPALQLKLD